MALALDHGDCQKFFSDKEKKKCLWPTFHADKKSYKEEKRIRDMDILDQHGVRAAGLSVLTRRMRGENIVRAKENSEQISTEKLLVIVKELSEGLGNKVYSKEGKVVIEATRVVLDFPALSVKLKQTGSSPVKVAATEYPKFRDAIHKVPVDSILEIEDEELKLQFKIFIDRLQCMTNNFDELKLKKIDSKELIKKFMDPAGGLFKGIEMIMQAVSVCAVKHSCESVLESFVSRYENHFDSRRNTEENSSNEEFVIAVNGPNLAHCDSVVREAMNDYWGSRGGEWHFIKRSVMEKLDCKDSVVLNRILKTPNSLPFMS